MWWSVSKLSNYRIFTQIQLFQYPFSIIIKLIDLKEDSFYNDMLKICRYGHLSKQYEVPLSQMLHDILDDDHIQWHPPLIGLYTNFWPLLIWTLLPNLTFYLIVQLNHWTYATGAACQTEDAYSSWHLVLSHFETCMCSSVETNLSWTCLVPGLLNFEHPSVLLFCLKARTQEQFDYKEEVYNT